MGIMDKAKRMIDQRGGTERLKQDAGSIKGIAKGRGTASEKAKRALDTVKQPAGTGAGTAGGPTHGDGAASDPTHGDRPASDSTHSDRPSGDSTQGDRPVGEGPTGSGPTDPSRH
jgi:hypothetical protein